LLRRRRANRKALLVRVLGQARAAQYRVRYWIARLEAEGGDKGVLETLHALDYILEFIALRVETILTLWGAVQGMERLPLEVVREASRSFQGIPPEIAASLSSIANLLAEASMAPGEPSFIIETSGARRSLEAEDVIRAAVEEARRRVASKTGQGEVQEA